jgi:murein peptide amidase A
MNSTAVPPSRLPAMTLLRLPAARSVEALMASFDQVSGPSPWLLSRTRDGGDGLGQRRLPRYVYLGPKGGDDPIRIAVTATIHGDEPEGALGLLRFLEEVEADPEGIRGYALFLYPLCNPTGYAAGTRAAAGGKDLNREFWQGSLEPEVRFLETEIWTHAFQGIINLHTDDTSEGTYGFVHGDVLSKNLLEPALRAAERFLPRDGRPCIDGFAAQRGVLSDCYHGILRSPPGLRYPPFEITFETPQRAPRDLQARAFAGALGSILTSYREMMAYAPNL